MLSMIVAAAAAAPKDPKPRKPGLYAVFDTSMGTFVCELYEKATPATVANFVALTEGKKDWVNPRGDLVKNTPYYNGVTFHRVIKGFMIQGGDVSGTGSHPAIAPFKDEIVSTLKFDRPGLLAMANAGPNTNRAQFFVTVAATPHLNGQHTIFGRVVEGYDVVERISKVRVDPGGRPIEKVVMTKVAIERVAKP
jgi:cyclophilin family peptidyl-prolyl cis-trans isomerase